MSYLVEVIDNYVYVKYSGVVDGLDIVHLTADCDFIEQLRCLNRVIHDFSKVDDVVISADQMRNLSVLSNVESNFTEQLIGVVIVRDEEGFERINFLKQFVKNPNWKIFAAIDFAEASTIIAYEKLNREIADKQG